MLHAQSEPGYPEGKEEKAVATAVEQLRKAMIDADKAMIGKSCSRKIELWSQFGGHIDDKNEFVEKIASGKSDFVRIELTEQTIGISGKTAIVRHILKAKTNDGGKPGGGAFKGHAGLAKTVGKMEIAGPAGGKNIVLSHESLVAGPGLDFRRA